MIARRFAVPLVAVVLICSISPAAPPDGKEPAKDGKAVGKPVLLPVWKKTTIGLPKEFDLDAERNAFQQKWVADKYPPIIKARQDKGRPMLPPATPRVAGKLLVYHNDRSIAAVALQDVDPEADDPIRAGELCWDARKDFTLVGLAGETTRPMLHDWFKRTEPNDLAEFFFNQTLATGINIVGNRVYTVDELGLLPPVDMIHLGYRFGPLDHAYSRNAVVAIALDTGKRINRFPALGSGRDAPENLYLSVPFVQDNLCYVVYEREGKLQLKCMSPDLHQEAFRAGEGARDQVSKIWDSTILARVGPIATEPCRRTHALHLSRAGDLIICPTNLGFVVAADIDTGKVKWKTPYLGLRADTAERIAAVGGAIRSMLQSFAPEWVVLPPVVVGDKYIYAPADFPELLCLNVADGKKVWSAKKGDGLYPAVIGDRVLVVGEKAVRALDLKDGTEKWKLDLPGLPCGRGAVLGDHYLVPVSEPKTWRGMIALVDVKNGKVTEVIKPDRDEPVGNLVVHQEFLISQTLTEIAVFPIRK